jgi:hypothetical protein
MKRILLVAITIIASLFSSSATAGQRSVCTVVPDPVSISSGEQYTITATGGIPFEYYEVIISQKHDGVTDEGRDWLGQADASGTVTATLTASPKVAGDPTGLLVGDAKVNVSRYRTGGMSGGSGAASTISSCTFTVVS